MNEGGPPGRFAPSASPLVLPHVVPGRSPGITSDLASDYNAFRMTMSGAHGAVSTARGQAAVASAHPQASALAIAALEDGGNAFDAAFVLAFALCIYHPQAGNLGGGGYLLYQTQGAPRPGAFNFREQAPALATREAFLKADGTPDPDRTAFGPLSVCVPGTVKAFFELQRRHGRLDPGALLTRIARCAEEGARLTQYEAECLNRLGPRLAASPEARSIYVRAEPYRAGDLLPNPNLARTLDELAREGEAAFYRGRIAGQIVADLGAQGGFLSAEDLAGYTLREVEPIAQEVAGATVWTVPPEAGGAMLLEILGMLDRDAFRQLPCGSAAYHHHLAQAAKLAFIDRMEYLGDLPLEDNAVYQGMLAPAALARHFALIDPARDTPSDTLLAQVRAGRPGPAQGRDAGRHTTHFAVVDAQGNAVSSSYTMNLRYGSKWAVAGAGFLLNGSMDSFAFLEGRENYFGVIGSAPNRFAPGKRPASNMAPVLVTRDGAVTMALGTPGGPTIPTTLAGILAATLIHGVAPDRAIDAGRLHHQGWPDTFMHEPGFQHPELLRELAEMGYAIKDKQELISDVHGVFREPGGLLAVSDHRREGQALATSPKSV